MKPILILFLSILFIHLNSSAQTKERKVYYFLSLQGDKTLYDFAKEKNPGGAGLGLQLNFRPLKTFQPLIELNAADIGGPTDTYFFIDNGSITHNTKEFISSIYVGAALKISNHIYPTFSFGPSFFYKYAHLGIRPSLIYYPLKNQKWSTKLSFTHVPFKDEFTNQDFGYLSFSIGINLSKL